MKTVWLLACLTGLALVAGCSEPRSRRQVRRPPANLPRVTLAPIEDRVPATVDEWKSFLRDFSKEALQADDRDENGRIFTDQQHAAGYLGSPPATEAEIEAAEARLKLHFPPSYRNFLLASNGWPAMGAACPDDVLRVEDVDTVTSREPSLADGIEYPTTVRTSIIVSGLRSDCGLGDGILMLAPSATSSEPGEWQCFDFAGWHPSIVRYASFGRRMVDLREFIRSQLDKNAQPIEDGHPEISAGPEPPTSP